MSILAVPPRPQGEGGRRPGEGDAPGGQVATAEALTPALSQGERRDDVHSSCTPRPPGEGGRRPGEGDAPGEQVATADALTPTLSQGEMEDNSYSYSIASVTLTPAACRAGIPAARKETSGSATMSSPSTSQG